MNKKVIAATGAIGIAVIGTVAGMYAYEMSKPHYTFRIHGNTSVNSGTGYEYVVVLKNHNRPVKNGEVKIYINGKMSGYDYTNNSGYAIFSIDDFKSGEYVISAKYNDIESNIITVMCN